MQNLATLTTSLRLGFHMLAKDRYVSLTIAEVFFLRSRWNFQRGRGLLNDFRDLLPQYSISMSICFIKVPSLNFMRRN